MILKNRLILKQISSVLLTDIFVKFLGFCILPLYLNFMPKSNFGEYGFIFTTSIMASSLMSFVSLLLKHLSQFNKATLIR